MGVRVVFYFILLAFIDPIGAILSSAFNPYMVYTWSTREQSGVSSAFLKGISSGKHWRSTVQALPPPTSLAPVGD